MTGVCRAEPPDPEKIAAAVFDSLIKGDSGKAVENFSV